MIKHLILLVYCACLCSNAQTNLVYDTTNNKDYESALRLFKDRNYDEALAMVNIGLEKAQKLQDKNQIACGYFYQARYYEKLGPYEESVRIYNKALTIFKALDDTAQVSRCYYKLGFNHFKLADYDIGLNYYFKSLKLDE